MFQALTRTLHRIGAALVLALAAQGAAHAGLVTGDWDPLFGAPLNNMSWQVKAEVLVPDACTNQPDGVYSTAAAGPCNGANPATFKVLAVWLRLFDTGLANAGDFFTSTAHSNYFAWCDVAKAADPHCYNTGNFFSASSVRVAAGQIVGFDTGSQFGQTFSCFAPCNNDALFFSAIPSAEGNLFGLKLTTNGPELTCKNCAPTFADSLADYHAGGNPARPDVKSTNAGLQQFLITNVSNGNGGQTPKFTDANGNPLGALLNSTGTYLGQSTSIGAAIPEPSALALALVALVAMSAFGRRRA